MGIGSGTAMLIGGLVGGAGSIASGAIGASAAGNAADQQAQAAEQAAQLQYQASQNALGFQEQQYNQGQQNLAPWLQSGQGGLANLDYLLGITPPGGQGQAVQAGGAPGTFSSGPGGPQPGGPSQVFNGQPGQGGMPTARPMAAGVGSTGSVPVPSLPGGATPTSGANLGSLVNPKLGGFGSLMQPYQGQFTAPTGLTEQNDPGYQARLQMGTDALQNSAAARGSVLTGGTAKALDQYAQDYASNEYGNVYNRAYNQYATNYNQNQQQQMNQYNRLAALAGVGQQTAGQLGMMGQNAANSISSNLMGTAANIGQQYNNAAAANASGIVGGANAWGNAIGGAGNNLQNLLLLSQLQGGSSPVGGTGASGYAGQLG